MQKGPPLCTCHCEPQEFVLSSVPHRAMQRVLLSGASLLQGWAARAPSAPRLSRAAPRGRSAATGTHSGGAVLALGRPGRLRWWDCTIECRLRRTPRLPVS